MDGVFTGLKYARGGLAGVLKGNHLEYATDREALEKLGRQAHVEMQGEVFQAQQGERGAARAMKARDDWDASFAITPSDDGGRPEGFEPASARR